MAARWRFWFLIAVPFVFLILARILHFNGLYGQDAHRYYQFAVELEAYFKNGTLPGDFRWPVLYSLTGFVLSKLSFLPADLTLQLLSASGLSVSSWFVYKTLILNGASQKASFFTVLVFLVFCPQLMVASVLCMSDVFGMMWVVLSWYYYFSFRKSEEIKHGILVGLFSSLALFSRYPVFFLIFWPAVHTFFLLLRRRSAAFLLFVPVFAIPAIPELVFQDTSESVGGSYLLNHWSPAHLFSDQFRTIDGAQTYRFINLLYMAYPVLHPAFFLVGMLFLLFHFKSLQKWKVSWILLISVGVYLIFLGGIPLQNRRFFLPAFPLIVILLAPAFSEALRSSARIRVQLGALLILQIAIGTWYFRDYWQLNRLERNLAAGMKPYEGKRLYAFYWDGALKSYCPNFDFRNLWETRYTDFHEGDLVLFNPDELKDQWKGTHVMMNWQYLEKNYRLTVRENFPENWKLYEIR